MEDSTLQTIWQSAQHPSDDAPLTHVAAETLSRHGKLKKLTDAMKPAKFFALVVGLLWVSTVSGLLAELYTNGFSTANKFFLFAASAQVLLTLIAIAIYVSQLVTIYSIEESDPVLVTQEKLGRLSVSTLWIVKVLILQLPLWTMFWWNDHMLEHWSLLQWLIVILFTAASTVVALWLFVNIKFANRNKKWFTAIFRGPEWTPLMSAMDLLGQVTEIRQPDSASQE